MICRCLRTDEEVEGLQLWCGNVMGPRKKAARGREEMNQGTL